MAFRSPLEIYARQAWQSHPDFLQHFVTNLPGKNPGRKTQLVFRCLRQGLNTHGILDRLREELELDSEFWDQLIASTQEEERLRRRIEYLEDCLRRHEEMEARRKDFRPHIHVLTVNRTPSMSITLYAMANLGSERYLEVDPSWQEAGYLSLREQLGAMIREHYATCGGLCPGMGAIAGYEYRASYDQVWCFDTQGQFQKISERQTPDFRAICRVGSQTLAKTP